MYLYIFEDGTVRQSPTPPTEDDLASVADGILTVIRFTDDLFQEVSSDEIWNDVELASAPAEGYHTP